MVKLSFHSGLPEDDEWVVYHGQISFHWEGVEYEVPNESSWSSCLLICALFCQLEVCVGAFFFCSGIDGRA